MIPQYMFVTYSWISQSWYEKKASEKRIYALASSFLLDFFSSHRFEIHADASLV